MVVGEVGEGGGQQKRGQEGRVGRGASFGGGGIGLVVGGGDGSNPLLRLERRTGF